MFTSLKSRTYKGDFPAILCTIFFALEEYTPRVRVRLESTYIYTIDPVFFTSSLKRRNRVQNRSKNSKCIAAAEKKLFQAVAIVSTKNWKYFRHQC